jgi:transposase-like protein
MEFMREYADDEACLESLWRRRYSVDGEHADCPKCETERVFKRYGMAQQRQSWTCTGCGHYLHPTAGTIFHKSSTSLHLWFYAMYLMASTRCGISAKQLERELGVTYKTAWRMAHLIRNSLMNQNGTAMLSGTVEADETWIGGKVRYRNGKTAPLNAQGTPKRGRRPKGEDNKTTVLGMVERSGEVRASVVPDTKSATLYPLIREFVMPRSTIYTDEAHHYRQIAGQGYRHRRIHHAEKVYVRGDVHTNTIEGFWSLVKRGIGGVYHSVSAKHLQGYLNEYAWRYNRRNEDRAEFETLLLRAALGS